MNPDAGSEDGLRTSVSCGGSTSEPRIGVYVETDDGGTLDDNPLRSSLWTQGSCKTTLWDRSCIT